MHPSENPQSLMFQGFGGPLKDAGGRGISFKRFYACFPSEENVFDRYNGRDLDCGGWLVGLWWVLGRCDRGFVVGQESGGIFMVFCSFHAIRLYLVSIGPGWDFGMKKHQRLLAGAGGSVGMVGFQGEEGVSWTSSIVTHFTDDACIMIDQSGCRVFLFFGFFAFQPPKFCPFFGPFDGLLRLLLQRFEAGQPLWVGEIVTKFLNFQKGS